MKMPFYELFFLILCFGCLSKNPELALPDTVASSDTPEDVITPDTGTPIPELPPLLKRPTLQVYIKPTYCSCLLGAPDILNNCEYFCSDKNDTVPTLYVSTQLGPEILAIPQLLSLWDWCNVQINSEEQNPKCQLEVFDGSSYNYLDITINEGSNSFSVNVSGLNKDTTYVAALVETGSGSFAKSQSFQIRRKDFGDTSLNTPLKIMGVNRYTCVTRSGIMGSDLGGSYAIYYNASKLFYYYVSNNRPKVIPPDQSFVFCHDEQLYPGDDAESYPRLELENNDLFVWDATDSRFYDQDGNQQLDVNDYIAKRLTTDFNIPTTKASIFSALQWDNFPPIQSATNSGTITKPILGYIMSPWRDQNTDHFYCPGQKEYEHTESNPVFEILKDLIGTDTEGLYIGVRGPLKMLNGEGQTVSAPEAQILIRESVVEKIWFYFDSKGRPVEPDLRIKSNKTLYFYWPPDASGDPYIQNASQVLFSVRNPNELTQNADLRPNIIPTDKRFACIPKPESNQTSPDPSSP